MAYSYKGAIAFGIVYIPITLQSSIKNNDISFNLIDRKTNSRIKYVKTCVDCDDRIVEQKDIVKGYEYESGKYVLFDNEDFEKIKSKKDKTINIECFVNIDEIDPLYFDRPFFVVPSGSEKAFCVLLKAMEDENKCAIAKTVLGTKETLIAIRAKNGQMLLNTLFFKEEVQKNPAKDVDAKIGENELKIAKQIIESMTSTFEPEKYVDEYRLKLEKAIEQKIQGEEIVAPKEFEVPRVKNLLEALEQSLKNLNKPKKSTSKNKPTKTKK